MIKVIFENENFVVVDKPAGWLSVPGRSAGADPRPCLSHELRARWAGALPVHRLDGEVSGVILFALGADAHRAGNAWFEGRLVKKRYLALTEGAPPPDPREAKLWECRLARGKKRAFEAPHGKPAVTRALWLRQRNELDAQEWLLEPLTGRSHQLRYEPFRHGHPILGDS
ncbi:MAG: RNA pseudouridine synthase, partial [Deltaproteobacteria bacterium]|nr:RNA pseudouridine synthase [Deltaproteobacteria bacterium]